MNIRTERTPIGDWYAIDDDTYDGAPDAGRASAMGWGKTEAEAIADLADQLGAETAYPNRTTIIPATNPHR